MVTLTNFHRQPVGSGERHDVRIGRTRGPREGATNLGQRCRARVVSPTRGRERLALNCLGDTTGTDGESGKPDEGAPG